MALVTIMCKCIHTALAWIPRQLCALRDLLWPRKGWRRRFAYFYYKVRRIADTPHRVAVGFACGALASFTPFFGFHFLIGIFLAVVLGGNLTASAFGTVVGNPLTFPVIGISSLQVGSLLLTGGLWEETGQTGLLLLAPRVLLGGAVIGIPISIMLYFLVRHWVYKLQQHRNDRRENREKSQRRVLKKCQQSEAQ